MYRDAELTHVVSANIEHHTNLWSTFLFWGSIPVVFLSQETGKTMLTAAFVLLVVRLLNNKLSIGRWLG
ncbi:hypothetical protein LG58_2563 [Kosakonia radicincitans YD4]|nr:hypothetical protein LG58_2563 [Kosakonia radicincitans YD4]